MRNKFKLYEKKIMLCVRKIFSRMLYTKKIIKALKVKHNNGEDKRLYSLKRNLKKSQLFLGYTRPQVHFLEIKRDSL